MSSKSKINFLWIVVVIGFISCKENETTNHKTPELNTAVNNSKQLISLKTVIRTKNFDASKRFYNTLLNLKITEEYDDADGSRGCIFKLNDNALIEISETSKGHSFYDKQFEENFGSNKIGIQIKTDSINYWTQHLSDKWNTRGPVLRPWGSHYLYLRDPDSLQIIIYEEKK